MRRTLTILLLLLSVGHADDAIVGLGGLTVSDFRFQGEGYLLEGEKATTVGDRIRIQQAKATIRRGDDVLVISAPEVVFNRATQRGSSDKQVTITSSNDNLEMTGMGFDADFRRQRVRIRQKARMKVRERAREALVEAVK